MADNTIWWIIGAIILAIALFGQTGGNIGEFSIVRLASDVNKYEIELTVDAPDSDYSDGTVEYQYGHWAILKNEEILESGTKEVEGYLKKTINIGDGNRIEAAITQIKGTFNIDKGLWEYGDEEIIGNLSLDLTKATEVKVKQEGGKITTEKIEQGFLSGIFKGENKTGIIVFGIGLLILAVFLFKGGS